MQRTQKNYAADHEKKEQMASNPNKSNKSNLTMNLVGMF